MKASIAAVWALQPHPFGGHPGGPAELAESAEFHRLDVARRQRQFHFPVELIADVEEHRIDERLAAVAGRQEAHVLRQAGGVDADANLVLHAEDGRADHDVAAHRAVGGAEQAAVARLDGQTGAGELLDLDADPEQAADEGAQARGRLGLRRHQPGKGQLGQIRHAVEIAIGQRAEADHGADIDEETVGIGAIVLHDRAGIGPGAEEQLQETMIEHVEEAGEGFVPVQGPPIRFFGGRQRERPLRPQQSQELGVNADLPALRRLDARQVGGREIHERILAEQDEVLAQRAAVADPRPIPKGTLEPAHDHEEVEPPGLLDGFIEEGGPARRRMQRRLQEGVVDRDRLRRRGGGRVLAVVEHVHSGYRVPMRVGQRMISPRSTVRMTVWVKWLSPAYSTKKRSRTAPSRNTPLPSNAFSSTVTVISMPRAVALPVSRCTRRTTGALSTLRTPRILRSVGPSAASPNIPSISRTASPPLRSTRPSWLRLSMLMSRQATAPVWATSDRLRCCDTTGSRGLVGPATQITSSVTSSRRRKSAPPSPTGRCSVRCRLEHRARTLSSATEVSSWTPAGSTSERNVSVPV